MVDAPSQTRVTMSASKLKFSPNIKKGRTVLSRCPVTPDPRCRLDSGLARQFFKRMCRWSNVKTRVCKPKDWKMP
jgi:hypothetical protein